MKLRPRLLPQVLVPIYLGELAPPVLRGFFGTCTLFAMVIGILVANVLAFPLARARWWRGTSRRGAGAGAGCRERFAGRGRGS